MSRGGYGNGGLTSVELARLCGVSQGTVDRALNGRPGIRPETKARILRTAAAHGYVKDLRASGLARGRSYLIGLVLFDLRNEYFAQIATAVEQWAAKAGYAVLILLSGHERGRERACLERLCALGVDGVILFPCGDGVAYEEWLLGLRRPVVTVGNALSARFCHVGPADEEAMAAATRAVLGRGYRRLIYVYTAARQEGRNNITAQRRRYDGFREAVSAYPYVDVTVLTGADYAREIAAAAAAGPRPAAICPSDYQALEVLAALRARGLAVPAAAGVLGFDNIAMLRYVSPRLTTVAYPLDEVGRAAAARLQQAIEGEPVTSLSLPTALIEGESL